MKRSFYSAERPDERHARPRNPSKTRRDPVGARWAMVGAGAGLIGTCYGLARFAYGPFAPEFAREFTISATLSGVIGAGSYVGYCAAIAASLILTPRWGPRPVAVLAGVVATVGMSIVALAPSAPVLAV